MLPLLLSWTYSWKDVIEYLVTRFYNDAFSGLAWQPNDQPEENNAWNGMIDNENDAVRDRLSDLEKKVHLQNDEIVCLKATLADCLRRLNSLEVGLIFSCQVSFKLEIRGLF